MAAVTVVWLWAGRLTWALRLPRPRPAAPVLIKSKASAAVSDEPEAPAKVFMRTAGTAHFGNCPFACASGFLCVVGSAVVAALGSASQRCRE